MQQVLYQQQQQLEEAPKRQRLSAAEAVPESGAGVAAPGVPLSEEGSTGATARAWLVMRTEEASQFLAQRIRLDLLGPDQLLVEPAA
eukprot:scaffold87618_cov48-Phaeocystis_antarctica.AAC.2